jgi:MoxR-like ATPase
MSSHAPVSPIAHTSAPPVRSFKEMRAVVKDEVGKAVVGYDEPVDMLLVAAVTGGHVLMEGPPGVAKTLVVGAVARALGVSFNRIQFTPDTSPTDVIGESVKRMGEAHFVPGPLFTNMLLADEINRTPPRVQAALLEAMQERHVTVDGRTRWLPSPFLVVATQNPFEHEGVFELPESQLDRFLFKVELHYGDEQHEREILDRPHRGLAPDMLEDVNPVLDVAKLQRAQDELDSVELPDDVARFIVRVVRATRTVPGVVLGGSPRSAVHLAAASRARALLDERRSATEEDVRNAAPHVLAHRLVLDSGDADEVVLAALAAV